MSKRIYFNVGGTPTDIPTISNDDPQVVNGVFEGTPPNRCVFTLPDTMGGGGHLKWDGNQVNFLLPPAGWAGEASTLGLPPLVYKAQASPVRVSGDHFVKSDGSPWIWKGITSFRLIERQLQGEDISGILHQAQDAGANLVRVLAMKTNNTGWSLSPFHPSYVGAQLKTLEVIVKAGMFCELTVFADTRSMMPRESDQQAFWAQTLERVRQFPLMFVELLNEDGHFTQSINPEAFPRPSGILTSHGSGLTDDHPVEPFWDYTTYHARREPDGRGFTNYDPYEFERDYPKPCPFICDEGIKPENYGFSPDYARRIGQHAACGAGGTFHWSGGVNSDLMDSATFTCAAACFQGMG